MRRAPQQKEQFSLSEELGEIRALVESQQQVSQGTKEAPQPGQNVDSHTETERSQEEPVLNTEDSQAAVPEESFETQAPSSEHQPTPEKDTTEPMDVDDGQRSGHSNPSSPKGLSEEGKCAATQETGTLPQGHSAETIFEIKDLQHQGT